MSLPPQLSLSALRSLVSKMGPLFVVLVMWLVVPALTGPLLVAKIGPLTDLLLHQPLLGSVCWLVVMALLVGLGLVPAYANSVVCAWVFGIRWGYGVAMGSYLLATLIGYAVGHRVGNRRVELLIGESAQAMQVRSALLSHSQRRAGLIVTLFRGTGFPYAAGTLLLASCGVSLRLAMVGAVCGLGPRVLMAMLVTAHLSRGGVRDVQALLRHSSDPTAVVLSLLFGLVMVTALSLLAKQALQKLTK